MVDRFMAVPAHGPGAAHVDGVSYMTMRITSVSTPLKIFTCCMVVFSSVLAPKADAEKTVGCPESPRQHAFRGAGMDVADSSPPRHRCDNSLPLPAEHTRDGETSQVVYFQIVTDIRPSLWHAMCICEVTRGATVLATPTQTRFHSPR